jgi:hypothetical protein
MQEGRTDQQIVGDTLKEFGVSSLTTFREIRMTIEELRKSIERRIEELSVEIDDAPVVDGVVQEAVAAGRAKCELEGVLINVSDVIHSIPSPTSAPEK